MIFLALIFAALSFTLSASAGLGGSLILVPAMSLILGPKEGIAVAALLLGINNIFKVFAYRQTLSIKAASGILLLTMLGAALGASLMVAAPERWVEIAIVISVTFSFLVESQKWVAVRRIMALIFAFSAGATSGFSGTSGPLKGTALRSLDLERMYFVGAASTVSLAGDAVKASIFIKASLVNATSLMILLSAVVVMPFAVYLGRFINEKIGERSYAALFWTVMTGYTIRLIL